MTHNSTLLMKIVLYDGSDGAREAEDKLSLPRSVLTFVVFLTLSGIALAPGAPHRTVSANPFPKGGSESSVSGRNVSDVRGLAVC
jgi:hypothetical protein